MFVFNFRAIAEAAYRTTVLAAGKNQKKLSVGWEVLGLNKEVATRIFEEELKEGFLSDREKMYGGQSRKYNSKGLQIDTESGDILDPEEAKAAEEAGDDDDAPVSNVYECGECGYTLFIAKGREFKFFGDDFECPECGAKKDKFNARNIDEE
jgi:rubrerythrin